MTGPANPWKPRCAKPTTPPDSALASSPSRCALRSPDAACRRGFSTCCCCSGAMPAWRDLTQRTIFRQGRSRNDFGPTDQGKRYDRQDRSEEHTSELQSLMRISYAVFCLKKKKKNKKT